MPPRIDKIGQLGNVGQTSTSQLKKLDQSIKFMMPPYYEDRLLVLVNPDVVLPPKKFHCPLGLPPEISKAFIALVPLGLIRIMPIVKSGFRFWFEVNNGSDGLTAAEITQLASLANPSIPTTILPGHMPPAAVLEMASRIELRFSSAAQLVQAADQLRHVPNIIRVEKPVRGLLPQIQPDPTVPPGSAPKLSNPEVIDWWRAMTGWNVTGKQWGANPYTIAAPNNIAVLDSGAQINHPAFNENALTDPYGGYYPYSLDDTYGHGTHVCSIIGGRKTTPTSTDAALADGVLPKSNILIFNIFTENDTTVDMNRMKTALFAIRWNFPNIKVINMSIWMADRPDQDLLDEFNKLEAQGIVLVACAGNQFDDSAQSFDYAVQFPARLLRILSVGSVDWQSSATVSMRSPFSRYSTWGGNGANGNDPDLWKEGRWSLVDIIAPGAHIWGAVPIGKNFFGSNNGAVYLRGTSMAAPMVTAAIGYLLSQPGWQNCSTVMARKAIRRCVDNVNLPTGLDPLIQKEMYGFGVLDFGKVAEAVLKGPAVFLS